ncbi:MULTISPECIES: hypothetical protein [unclassified Moorena]|uniref:hypothetical protein n=1 Tax=unclassified Moorena TaxID=2683338 RepID=UPI0013FFE6DC|nr:MULTISPECIES: hypothetical protein [unclassified Moorena]NEO17613.1 hypothetical protein [Moorena sp. SIO3E8]NEQ04158.1 hypothetical protein [Moorena sp. SIO3F7]
MRYTLFFPSSLFPLPCSLLPAPCSLKPRYLYLIGIRLAIFECDALLVRSRSGSVPVAWPLALEDI